MGILIMKRNIYISLMLIAAGGLLACNSNNGSSPTQAQLVDEPSTPRAECGPGSRPETGMQGRVSQADHDAGLAELGFSCNTELAGSYFTANAVGTVGGFKVERYVDKTGRECAYYYLPLIPISETTRPLYIPYAVFCLNKININTLSPSPPYPSPVISLPTLC